MNKSFIWIAALFLLMVSSGAHAITPKSSLDQQAMVVKNSSGEEVGTISKALEDPNGDIAFVIVSLNNEHAGKKDIVVPVSALSSDGSQGLILDMTDQQLAAAPEFRASDLQNPGYADRLYRFYGQTPPWSEGDTEGQGR